MNGVAVGLCGSCGRCGRAFSMGERVHMGMLVHETQQWVCQFAVCLACAGRMLDDSAARRAFHQEVRARGELEFAEPAGRA